MVWNEFFVDRVLANMEIGSAFAAVFGIDMQDIEVINDIYEELVEEQTRVVCEQLLVQGDFHLRLTVYVRDARLAVLDRTEAIVKFCGLLECVCLISDDTPNPYRWLLVQGDGSIRPVFLDLNQLDDEEHPAYIVAQEAA